jgi:hypothetical protein
MEGGLWEAVVEDCHFIAVERQDGIPALASSLGPIAVATAKTFYNTLKNSPSFWSIFLVMLFFVFVVPLVVLGRGCFSAARLGVRLPTIFIWR